jgi:tetrahydromethanopterin S-methyltransferase subunit G
MGSKPGAPGSKTPRQEVERLNFESITQRFERIERRIDQTTT